MVRKRLEVVTKSTKRYRRRKKWCPIPGDIVYHEVYGRCVVTRLKMTRDGPKVDLLRLNQQ